MAARVLDRSADTQSGLPDLSIDRLSLEQAFLDQAIANQRVIALTRAISAAAAEVKELRHRLMQVRGRDEADRKR